MAKRKSSKPRTPDPTALSFQDEETQMMLSVQKALGELGIQSPDQVQAFLDQFTGMKMSDVTNILSNQSTLNPEEEADMLALEAMNEPSKTKVTKKLQQALKKDPDCTRALIGMGILQEEVADAEAWFRKAIASGERKLGGLIGEYSGQLWGFLGARPYLEARSHLAELLYLEGRLDEAIAENEAILSLNTIDNQGIRHILIGQYLEARNWDAANALLKRYPKDPSATWLYGRAMLKFERQASIAGWNTETCDEVWLQNQMDNIAKDVPPYLPKQIKEADGVLLKALKANPWCAVTMMTAHQHKEIETPEYYVFGSEEEGRFFFCMQSTAWARNPGALLWLSVTAMPWLLENGYADLLM